MREFKRLHCTCDEFIDCERHALGSKFDRRGDGWTCCIRARDGDLEKLHQDCLSRHSESNHDYGKKIAVYYYHD